MTANPAVCNTCARSDRSSGIVPTERTLRGCGQSAMTKRWRGEGGSQSIAPPSSKEAEELQVATSIPAIQEPQCLLNLRFLLGESIPRRGERASNISRFARLIPRSGSAQSVERHTIASDPRGCSRRVSPACAFCERSVRCSSIRCRKVCSEE